MEKMGELDKLVRDWKVSMVFEEDGILVVNYKGASWKKRMANGLKYVSIQLYTAGNNTIATTYVKYANMVPTV